MCSWTTKAWQKVPYGYAGRSHAGGPRCSLQGLARLDEQGNVNRRRGTHRAQAEKSVENLLAVLGRHGAGPADLVKTTVYVVGDRPDLIAVWDVVAARLEPHRPPSTLLGVAVLRVRDQLVEIEGIAALSA